MLVLQLEGPHSSDASDSVVIKLLGCTVSSTASPRARGGTSAVAGMPGIVANPQPRARYKRRSTVPDTRPQESLCTVVLIQLEVLEAEERLFLHPGNHKRLRRWGGGRDKAGPLTARQS